MSPRYALREHRDSDDRPALLEALMAVTVLVGALWGASALSHGTHAAPRWRCHAEAFGATGALPMNCARHSPRRLWLSDSHSSLAVHT